MRTIGVVAVLLLLSAVCATAADPAEELTPERRQELERKAAQLPLVEGRKVFLALWLKAPAQGSLSQQVIAPQQVLAGLR